MSKKNILVMFGGVSAEHEVSVVTGLQILEAIDRTLFNPFAVYLTQESIFLYYPGFQTRQDFKRIKPVAVCFGRNDRGIYMQPEGMFKSKQMIDGAYLGFHGGNGESGPVQGLLETLRLPFTSPGVEGSVITMNKGITKDVLRSHGLPTVQGVTVVSEVFQADGQRMCKQIITELNLPVIVKPAHLGSSIGIHIAKTEVELEKYLTEACLIDSEVVVEKCLSGFREYNCAVRRMDHQIITSEIEKPISHDEILSFADKYQRGGKKQGAKQAGGMASLDRELPAKISNELRDTLQALAKQVFQACRCKGMVRIDFMVTEAGEVFVTEINPIPGSMSFYLWEASGMSFKEQITQLIHQAFEDQKQMDSRKLSYHSDIIEKFIG